MTEQLTGLRGRLGVDTPPAAGGELVVPEPGAVIAPGQTPTQPDNIEEYEPLLVYLRKMTGYWDRLLPAHIPHDQFISAVFTALYDDKTLKNLAKGNHQSLLHSLMMAAHFGLVPDGVQAALVPFKGRIQFMPMYQGLIDLMHVGGGVTKVEFDRIYEGEKFQLRRGAPYPDDFWHEPDISVSQYDDSRRCLAAYAYAMLPSGERSQVVTMSPEDALYIAARFSQSYQAAENKRREDPEGFKKNPGHTDYHSPWHDNFPPMHKKTVAKQLAKVIRTNPLLNGLIKHDNAIDSTLTDRPVTPMEVVQVMREASQAKPPPELPSGGTHRFVYQDDSDACGRDGCTAFENDEVHLRA